MVAHGRLNRAATALNLTESAVSHHLARLEHTLGVRLLERGRAQAVLTPAGERFHARARDALDLLEEALTEVADTGTAPVALTLPRAVATHWLVPRLTRLHARHDNVELQLLPTTRTCDLVREQIDLGIRLGGGSWHGLVAEPLLRERTIPVATPDLARQWREAGWEAMRDRGRLIVNAAHLDEWRQWCCHTGRPPPPAWRTTALESFDFVLQAALAGSGLAMGRTPMIADSLARGDLVAPFPEWAVGEQRYFLVWPERRPPRRHARIVIDWLAECATESADCLWDNGSFETGSGDRA